MKLQCERFKFKWHGDVDDVDGFLTLLCYLYYRILRVIEFYVPVIPVFNMKYISTVYNLCFLLVLHLFVSRYHFLKTRGS